MKTPHADIAGCARRDGKKPISREEFNALLAAAHRMLAAAGEVLNTLRIHDPVPESCLSVKRILRVVAADAGLLLPVMTQANRGTEDQSTPRMVAMYLARRLTNRTLEAIGEEFGGRDHGTVKHAIKKIRDRMETDPAFARHVAELELFLQTKG